ncbi:unnamed protein product [Caenorhabditis auriculariae]|uniref:SMC hinge domain-containing protein n=1 Tax=Caenorhabditis auriculariae TaxID=2777116 RepID=A0A8S1HGD3_9PELO|nr:unnamed protein product [Caenorhabditis auriculariae]
MPPKKRHANSPEPASDESISEPEEEKRPKKKTSRIKPKKDKKEIEENQPADTGPAHHEDFDENEDLLGLPIPPRPDLSFGPGKGRLVIVKMNVFNFKSYYGRTCIGPFHKCFTSVIGPNGSGKSNVIDALLFVFGFRSSKIRSKKISSLIHKSSNHLCDHCSVEIVFERIIENDENSEDFEIIQNSRLAVSRTAYSDNTSKYAINGKTKSFKEVEETLRYAGIDLVHNRFLILQGEVEAISMMKPIGLNPNEEGMLEYLDDIIGTCRFMQIIKKFDCRLEKLQATLSIHKIRKDMARSDKEELEPVVKETLRFLRRENEATSIRSKLLQIEKITHLDHVQPTQAEFDAKQSEFEAARKRKKEIVAELKGFDEADQQLATERTTALDEIDSTKKQIEDAETSQKRRKNNIKRVKQDLSKLNTRLDEEKKKREEKMAVPEKSAKKIEALKAESEELKRKRRKNAKQKMDEALPVFENQSELAQKEKKEIEEEFGKRNTVFNEIKSKTTIAEAELSDLRKIASKDKNRLIEFKNALADTEQRLEKEKKELVEINEKLPEDEKSLKETQKAVENAQPQKQKLANEVRTLNSEISQRKNTISNDKDQDRLYNELEVARLNGTLPGLIGRLGDLATIEEKYDVALCSNMLGNLNNYVCETKDDAEKAIDFLAKNQIGRASFVCMDVIPSYQKEMAAGNFPAPRAFDLLKISEDRLRKVFYHSLFDTIVLPTILDAQNIHSKYPGRYNMFTECGSSLSTTASITGGGAKVRGLIGKKSKGGVNKAEQLILIEKMEKELAEKSEQLEKLTGQLTTLDQKIFELRTSINRMTDRKRQLDMSLQGVETKIATLKKTIASQEIEAAKVHVDEKDLEQRQVALDEMIKERDAAGARVAKYRAKLDEINAKIDEIFNNLVQVHKDEAKAAHDRYVVVEKKIAAETAAIASSARNIEKIEEVITQIEKDIEKKEKEMVKLDAAEDEADVGAAREALIQLDAKLQEFDERFNELRKNRSALTNEETSNDKLLQNLEEDVTTKKHQLAVLRSKCDDIEKKLDGMRLNVIPVLPSLDNVRPEELKLEIGGVNELSNVPIEELRTLVDELSAQTYAQEYGLRAELANKPEEIGDNEESLEKVPLLPEEELRAITKNEIGDLNFQLKAKEQRLSVTRKNVNISVIDEYRAKVKKYNKETDETNALLKNYEAHHAKSTLIKRIRHDEFKSGLEFMSASLREFYQMITLGGDAVLSATGDPYIEGVKLVVRPPKKTWKNIENLSGGEKTIASLSLVFALHQFRPTPFYVMDEIDAALDFRNVSIIGHYIKSRAKNAQFIIISLRNNMFELANRLIGIFKVNDVTGNIALDPMQVCKSAKALQRTMFGGNIPTLPEEVTAEYNRNRKKMLKEAVADEKEYDILPSSKDLNKAGTLVALETRINKAKKQAEPSEKRPETRQEPSRVTSTRPESQLLAKLGGPNIRLVAPSREELNQRRGGTEADESVALEGAESPPKGRRGRKRRSNGTSPNKTVAPIEEAELTEMRDENATPPTSL